MKTILAIETSSLSGGIALMNEERLIADIRLNVDVRHSERVMVSMDHLLKQSQTAIADLDAIAVSIGPGSFTGLRVGLATAKGLAVGAGLPLILVPTLEAFAAAFAFALPLIVPFIDARRAEVYWAMFDLETGVLCRKFSDAVATPEAALKILSDSEEVGRRPILFVGDGALKYREMIEAHLPEQALFATRALQFPSAASLAELALAKLLKGEVCPPDLAAPLYLRASYAETQAKSKIA